MPFPTRILWFYTEWQPIYDRIKQILPQPEFALGIDNEILEKIQASQKNLVVLADLMTSAGESKQISKLFTQEAHWKNFSVIFIVQNLFCHGRERKSISLNVHYLLLYKNPLDKSQIRYLAQQIFHENSNFLIKV